MKINEEQITLAAKLLRLPENKIIEYSHEIKDVDAVYISVPIKGGESIIISANCEVLYANSSVGYDVHLKEYLAGRRTPLEAFEETK